MRSRVTRVPNRESSAAEFGNGAEHAVELSPQAQGYIERQVAVRIPEDILDEVDRVMKMRSVRIPRHTWLLEAIVEKLEREAPRDGK